MATKYSGAREGQDKNGKHYVSAWWASKFAGMVALIASEDKNYPKRGEAVRGRLAGHEWIKYRCKVTFKDQGREEWVSANWWPKIGKLKIRKYGWVASTKSRNGGYFGKSSKPKGGGDF